MSKIELNVHVADGDCPKMIEIAEDGSGGAMAHDATINSRCF